MHLVRTKRNGAAGEPSCATLRSATVWGRMSGAVGEPGTIQAISSRTMQPKPRLFFLSSHAEAEPREVPRQSGEWS